MPRRLTTLPCNAIDAVSIEQAWTVGDRTIVRCDAGECRGMELPVAGARLLGVDMLDAGRGWAVGEAGLILAYGSPATIHLPWVD